MPDLLSRETLQRLGVTPASTTLTLTLSATEYTYTIPDGTKRLIFKLRSGSYDFQYGWATGQLNITVPASVVRDMSDINLDSKTLFVKCNDAAGQVLEIEYFQ